MRIISGMHRSGTSLVARLFHEAGADMGDPAAFYGGDRWNPDGYYEQPAVHAINMPLIHGPFWKLAYLSLPSPQTIARRATKMGDAIRRASDEYGGRIVKEARFCLTLEAWLAEGANVDRMAVVMREPGEVARSLKRRNRIPMRLGYSLWLAHNERLLEATRAHDIPLHCVRYGLLLEPDRRDNEISAAFAFMGLDVEPAEARRLVARVAKQSKNKSRRQEAATDYPARVKRLWDELLQRHRQQGRQG
jgi:hypothetical protein